MKRFFAPLLRRRSERRPLLSAADRKAVEAAFRDGRPVQTGHLTTVIRNHGGWC